MGIRETLNKNSALTTGGTIAIILLALGVIGWEMKPKAVKIESGYYFSSDDGQTWFADDMTNYPPYQHNGQDAVLANVYTCGGNKFVLYLAKYTADMKATLDDPNHGAVSSDSGTLVKKPGDKDWVPLLSADGKKVTKAVCPDGSTNGITPVLPGDQ